MVSYAAPLCALLCVLYKTTGAATGTPAPFGRHPAQHRGLAAADGGAADGGGGCIPEIGEEGHRRSSMH